MKVDKIVIFSVCIIFLVLILIISEIEPDSALFLFLFLYSLGIIIAILSLIMSKKFIYGSVCTGIYVLVGYLVIFILIPVIGDRIHHIYTNEQVSFLDMIIPQIILLMLLYNFISFTIFFILGKILLRLSKQ